MAPDQPTNLPSTAEILQQAESTLAQGDARAAFAELRPILEYPNVPGSAENWRRAFEVFARISEQIAGAGLAQRLRQVARQPDDVRVLYDCGYELIEHGLNGIAATVLGRANQLSPGEAGLIFEFAHALESDGHHAEVCQVLRREPDFLAQHFIARYLLAFNSLMSGDIDATRQILPGLEAPADDTEAIMAARLSTMMQRVDVLQNVGRRLDRQDLRGWHFVINGALLLHVSPYGFDEGMNGRYAFVQDSDEACLQGIRRLQAVLEEWQMSVPRVFALPDQDSAALAHAVALAWNVPLAPWPAAGSREPGLLAVYDVGALQDDVLETLIEHRPGQILWSHACCWTQVPPFAPDVAGFLYQHNAAPWDAALQTDPATQQVVQSQPDVRDPRLLAQNIVGAQLSTEDLQDLEELRVLARALATLPREAAPGALQVNGERPRQWEFSPVLSSRFL